MNKIKPTTKRKRYRRPELTAYGSLQQLTTGGTGLTMEEGNSMNPTNVNKYP